MNICFETSGNNQNGDSEEVFEYQKLPISWKIYAIISSVAW